MKKFVLLPALALSFFILASTKADKVHYNEPYRPQYHFTPERNFMENPAGAIFYEGEYHLFYQCNPKGNEPGFSHWGHSSSQDLLHWKHHPLAIFPDNLSEDKEFCTALPGSVIIDEKNLLGKEKEGHKTLVIFYTSQQCGQRIAFSNDGGNTWQKYAGNPILTHDESEGARNPKVFWHEPSGKWVMLLYRKLDNDERKQGFSFYNSSDLVHWEFQSHLAGFRDAPDLVELRVNNRPDDTRWVIFEGDGSYIIGHFDGKKFTPESIRMRSDFGKNYRGSVTWNNLPPADSRTIQVSLMAEGEWSGMPFNGQMTFPAELTLKKFNAGIFLIRQPAREIEKLHGKGADWNNENLIPGIGQNLVKKVEGDCLRIKGRFDLKTCETFGFMLRAGKKNQGVELVYSVKRQTLSILGQTVPLEPVDNKIYLDILLDRASVEIFSNNGRAVVSNLFWNQEKDREYVLFNTGGELMVEELAIYPVTSVWQVEK